jgi:hypothetical protein
VELTKVPKSRGRKKKEEAGRQKWDTRAGEDNDYWLPSPVADATLDQDKTMI